jgi:hypothetical protein
MSQGSWIAWVDADLRALRHERVRGGHPVEGYVLGGTRDPDVEHTRAMPGDAAPLGALIGDAAGVTLYPRASASASASAQTRTEKR